jgi:hypothetical protein
MHGQTFMGRRCDGHDHQKLIQNGLLQPNLKAKLNAINGMTPMKMMNISRNVCALIAIISWLGISPLGAADIPPGWKSEWPKTNFAKKM